MQQQKQPQQQAPQSSDTSLSSSTATSLSAVPCRVISLTLSLPITSDTKSCTAILPFFQLDLTIVFFLNFIGLFHLGRIRVLGKLYREHFNQLIHSNPLLSPTPSDRMAYEKVFHNPNQNTKVAVRE
jgi:hypothetical protein